MMLIKRFLNDGSNLLKSCLIGCLPQAFLMQMGGELVEALMDE